MTNISQYFITVSVDQRNSSSVSNKHNIFRFLASARGLNLLIISYHNIFEQISLVFFSAL